MSRDTLRQLKMPLAFIAVVMLVAYAIRLAGNGLGIGPYWVEYQTPAGIPYACMYPSKQDFIDATLDRRDHYHDRQVQNQR